MMTRFGLGWGAALVSLMLLGGCMEQDPAGPDSKNEKDLLIKGGDTTGTLGGKDSSGIINPPEICPAIYLPVCGEDGKTYGNNCVAAMHKVKVAREGACDDVTVIDPIDPKDPIDPIDPGKGWICTMEYAPVCDEDGNTYSNACFARRAGVVSPVECLK